jgi:hypothetical protein
MKHAIDYAQVRLIELSAPTLKKEYVYVPLRPPVKPATATLGEMLAVKRQVI